MFLIDISAKQTSNGLGLESFLWPKHIVFVRTTSRLKTDEQSSRNIVSSDLDLEVVNYQVATLTFSIS